MAAFLSSVQIKPSPDRTIIDSSYKCRCGLRRSRLSAALLFTGTLKSSARSQDSAQELSSPDTCLGARFELMRLMNEKAPSISARENPLSIRPWRRLTRSEEHTV